MPGLKAIISADSTLFRGEMARIEAMANGTARKMNSTIFNPTALKGEANTYAEWWKKATLERDVEAATRSNRARQLLRQRAANREAADEVVIRNKIDADVEAASRRNRARALLRERAEARSNVKIDNAKLWKGIGMDVLQGDLQGAAVKAGMLVNKMGMLKYVLNPVTGIVLGLVAGFAAAYKLTQHLVDKLSGLKMPDFHPEYIAKHLSKLGQVAEAHREINKEVNRTAELYDSAAKAAERMRGVVKDQYDHQRKMNEAAEEEETNKAKARGASEEEIQAIRKKYSDMNLDLQKQEHAAQIQMMQDEKTALEAEAAAKSKQADAIAKSMPSAASDKNVLAKRKQEAEEAQKYLDEVQKNPKGTTKDKIMRAYNAVALSGVSGADLDKAEVDNKREAKRRIKAYESFVDEAHGRDVQRERMNQLNQDAAASASRAEEIGKSIPDQQRVNAQQQANSAAEAAAKLAAQAAAQQSVSLAGSVTNNQRLGAYISPVGSSQLQEQKGMHHQLREINTKMGKLCDASNPSSRMGGVVF